MDMRRRKLKGELHSKPSQRSKYWTMGSGGGSTERRWLKTAPTQGKLSKKDIYVLWNFSFSLSFYDL